MPKNRNFGSRTSTFFWSTSAQARLEIFFCSCEAPPRGGTSRVKGVAPKRCVTIFKKGALQDVYLTHLSEKVHCVCCCAPLLRGSLRDLMWKTFLKRCSAQMFANHLFKKVSWSPTYLPVGCLRLLLQILCIINTHNTSIHLFSF